jgi:hypothetical protein
MDRVLQGALQVWGVQGSIARDHDDFVLCTAQGTEVRVARAAPRGWRLLRDDRLLGEAAGLPGLLRLLREELAPGAARGRLILGSPLR